jgi:hypothetical protein
MTPRHWFVLVLLRFTPALLRITEHYWAICLVRAKRLTNVLSDHAATSQYSTRGNVTHSATYEHFFPPLFFIFNLIFSRHPLPYYSLPPNTTQEQCFLPSVSWAVGWLRIQRGQRQARQRTQRSVRALPEVRVWRPVQNVSIVFCARQNIVKYYDDLQLCDW